MHQISLGRLKAKIIWCDIDPTTRIASLEEIKKKFSKTKAILVTHLMGLYVKCQKYLNFVLKIISLWRRLFKAFRCRNRLKKGTMEISHAFFHAQKNVDFRRGGMLVVNNSKINLLINLNTTDMNHLTIRQIIGSLRW